MDRFSYKERSMTPLGQRLIEDIRLRNFSKHTVEAYVRAVAHFARHYGCSPEQLDGEQVRAYLLYLVQERKVSWSLYNQTRCDLAGTADLRFPSSWRKASRGLSRKCQFVRFVLSDVLRIIYRFMMLHIARLSATVLGKRGCVARWLGEGRTDGR
jgi:Phage integrase, N-terminal SAM-like domain